MCAPPLWNGNDWENFMIEWMTFLWFPLKCSLFPLTSVVWKRAQTQALSDKVCVHRGMKRLWNLTMNFNDLLVFPIGREGNYRKLGFIELMRLTGKRCSFPFTISLKQAMGITAHFAYSFTYLSHKSEKCKRSTQNPYIKEKRWVNLNILGILFL